MSNTIQKLGLTIAMTASLVLVPAAAPAQQAEVSFARHPTQIDSWSRDLRRQPAVEEALRAHGFRSDRLSRQEERALGETYGALFPDSDMRRHRLNRTQATALVYMALVHPVRSGDGARTSRRAACESVSHLVQDMENTFAAPARGESRYLHPAEQQRIRATAREVMRLAEVCGERRLTDATIDLLDLVSEQRPERERVARQVSRLRSLARLALAAI